jgi:hypothetical protein
MMHDEEDAQTLWYRLMPLDMSPDQFRQLGHPLIDFIG